MPLIPPNSSFESRTSISSPTRSYTYRTPGLSSSFDKEVYTSAKDPSSPTSTLVHMSNVISPARPTRADEYSKQPLKDDDGSDTSDTTGSREGREEAQVEQFESLEVEVVSMETTQGFVKDGVVISPARTKAGIEKDKQLDSSNQNSSTSKPKTEELLDKQLPERQKTAMQAFLTSPTNLNWDDLVRSMREEMFIQTVTIQRNGSDDSSLGSWESGENKSVKSMDSSLSSKSAFRKRSRGRAKMKGGPASSGRRKKRESLEKRVEKVLLTGKRTSNSKNSKHYLDESHPLLNKPKIVGGKRCTFSAVTKLPSVMPNTPLDPPSVDDEVVPPPMIDRVTWFNSVDNLPVTPFESGEVVVPHPVGSRLSQDLSDVKESPSQSQPKADASISNEDPPLLLKFSISGDSDEDSFYYHIRGKSSSKSTKLGGSRAKSERYKNPYAFSNHPLLAPLIEEGNISPFPTTFDELDSDGEPDVDRQGSKQQEEELEAAAGQALGSFAASIGMDSRLLMYTSKSNRRRKQSLWQKIFCRKTRAVF